MFSVQPQTIRLPALRAGLQFLQTHLRTAVAWPLAALVVIAIGWLVLLSKLDADLMEQQRLALVGAAALARSYADQLARTVDATDQILLHVKFEWEISKGKLQLEDLRSQGLFPASSYFNVAIADRDGKVITAGRSSGVGLSVASRDFFSAQKTAVHDFLYISAPLVSPVSGEPVILFSRRIDAADGGFGGIVMVSVTPAYLTANYDNVTLGPYGLLSVVGHDDVVRVTRTGDKVYPPGTNAFVLVPDLRMSTGSTLLDGKEWFFDGRSRYVGWAPIGGWGPAGAYPLSAQVGLDQETVLAGYRANRAASLRTAGAASIVMAILSLIAMAFSLRLAWRKHKLELTQSAYRMATEGGNEGFYILQALRDPDGNINDFEIMDSNHRGAQLFRHRREELLGQRVSRLSDGMESPRLMQILRDAMEKGAFEHDIEVSGTVPLAARWIHLKIVRMDDELAVTLRDISEAKAHVEELVRRGNEDSLTGLPNRHWVQTYLPQALERAGATQMLLALLFVDLDGFKRVNDSRGHAAGDELLRNAAHRLRDAIRPHDYVARLGGDEFVVILEQIAHKTDIAHVVERIQSAFKQSFRLSQGTESVGASIGISVFPDDGADANTLLQNADIAMYSVKTSGKGRYSFYDQKFYDALRIRLEQEAELRRAIDQDQFVMYYQPRVDIASGNTSSLEALVRWAHPTKGLLSPLEFIPLAEETGLILGLGELVIDKVCAQLKRWSRQGQALVPVSINVSARQFNEVDMAALLAAALEHHALDPALVEIEVTESSMMGDSQDVSSALEAIRRIGVKLLVDDFGTGYSSLSQLQGLDFDVLKVDRAFTVQIDRTEKGQVFFNAIITMAHALGMRVVAEGVENEAQIRILKALRCDEIQGFYISRPVPAADTQPVSPTSFSPMPA